MHCLKLNRMHTAFAFVIVILLAALTFPSFVYAADDETAPVLTGVKVSPEKISKPGVVKVSLSFTEEETGMNEVRISLVLLNENGEPAAGTVNRTEVYATFSDLSLYTGTRTFDIAIPETAKNGEWTVNGIWLSDNAGNDSQFIRTHTHMCSDDGMGNSTEWYVDPYIGDGTFWDGTGQKPDVFFPCADFKVYSEFDFAFQYGADSPNLASALKNMKAGEAGEVMVNDRNGYVIPAAAFSAIKAQDKYLVINDGGVQWVFYGKNILDEGKSVDVRTTVSNVSGSNYGVTDDVVQVEFADNGQLPGKAQIRLKSDYLYNRAGVKGTVYVYYKTKGALTLESSSNELVMDGTDKWCYFDVTHNSTFILAPQKLSQTSSNAGNKWVHGSKGWWYSYSDGTYAKGLQKIGNASYYFDSNGWMKTGWVQTGGAWYYFSSSGAMTTGWQRVGGAWYYMASDGKMQTGWVDNSRYYCNGSGAMLTGWQRISNTWYYFNGSGLKTTGWQRVGGAWYLMGSDGKMLTGWQTSGNAKYYLASSGAMQTGWLKDGSTWCYLSGSGAMQTGWVKAGAWYLMGSDGKMLTGWQTSGNAKYYLASSGAMQTGWLKDGSTWYYLSGSGAMTKGWQKVGGAWYYMDAEGKMQVGWYDDGKVKYYLSGSGAMVTGWQQLSGKWYFFDGSGAMQKNRWIGGIYWVGSDGIMATDAWVDNDQYKVDANGKWIRGAKK